VSDAYTWLREATDRDYTRGLVKGRVVIGCKYCSGGPFRSADEHTKHMVKHPRRKRAS
jgi:hypothetical protein